MNDLSNKAQSLKLFISAGESSGDKYGQYILQELIHKTEDIENCALDIRGMGGTAMQSVEEFNCIHDSTKLGIIGIIDVLMNLTSLYSLEKKLQQQLTEQKPNVALLIDYPGLHLRLAKWIKKNLPYCKIIFFNAPQVWAWHYSRIHKLPKLIDRLLCILPFEEELHNNAGTSCKYIGNPSMWLMSQILNQNLDIKKTIQYLNLQSSSPIIGVFAGSRKREIQFMMPVYIQAITELLKIKPDIQFILVRSKSVDNDLFKKYIPKELQAKITITDQDNSYLVQVCSDIIWAKSGTNSLEACCANTPTIIGYKEWPILWIIFEKIRYRGITSFIGLPNILAGEEICPELVQDKCTPVNFINTTTAWLDDNKLLEAKRQIIKDQLITKLNNSQNMPFVETANEILFANKLACASIANKKYIQQRAEENSRITSSRKRSTIWK